MAAKHPHRATKRSDLQQNFRMHFSGRYVLPVILLITALIFINSFQNDFILNGDDDGYVLNNLLIRHLDWPGLNAIFTTNVAGNYHPLTILSFAIEYHFFGLNAMVYHLTNLLLHLCIVALVYFFIKRFFDSAAIAALCSLLFAIHPLHVEPVAWISSRKDLLYTLFFLVSLIYYSKYLNQGRKTASFVFAFLFFGLSLLSKSVAVVLPLILLLMDYHVNKKIIFKDIILKIPFFILSLLFGIVAVRAQTALGAVSDLSPVVSLLNRLALVSYSVVWYIFKAIVPSHLSVMHYYPKDFTVSLPAVYYLSLIAVALIGWIIIRSLNKRRELVFGLSFYIITILPVVQILPVGQAIVSERYSYLPLIGFFFIVSYYLVSLKPGFFQRFLLFIFSGWLIFLGVSSFNRVKIWKNQIILFNDVIEKYPDHGHSWWTRGFIHYKNKNYEAALLDFDDSMRKGYVTDDLRFCRGVSLMNLNRPANALAEFDYLVARHPEDIKYLYNRGTANDKAGRFTNALSDFSRIIQISPLYAHCYNSRGIVYSKMNLSDSAIIDFSKAIEIDSTYPDGYYNRANIFNKTGQYMLAVADYSKAIALKPATVDILINRGLSFMALNQLQRAMDDFNNAIQINPQHADTWFNRARLYELLNRNDQALADYNRGLELRADALAYYFRGMLKENKADIVGAVDDYSAALRLNSGMVFAYYSRANALFRLKNKEAACTDWQAAQRLGHPEAHRQLLKYCK